MSDVAFFNAGRGQLSRQLLLWTNPEPDAIFDAQSIELDLSEFKLLRIICRTYVSATQEDFIQHATRFIFTDDDEERAQLLFGTYAFFSICRPVWITSEGIEFGDNYDVTGTMTTPNNRILAPLYIYGIR